MPIWQTARHSIMCALNLCPGVWMCGYIVKVCGSKSRAVRAIGDVNLC
jgi:hypothetical protein